MMISTFSQYARASGSPNIRRSETLMIFGYGGGRGEYLCFDQPDPKFSPGRVEPPNAAAPKASMGFVSPSKFPSKNADDFVGTGWWEKPGNDTVEEWEL